MRPIQVGLMLPGSERRVQWAEYAALARAAEEVGFDSIRMGDHLLYRDPDGSERGPLEVWTTLSALATVTSRIRLGPLVACPGFHPPGVIAKMAATLDHISGGRLVLGLGAGWNKTDFTSYGLPSTMLVSRFEESFEIVRRALTGEHVRFDGRYWSVDLVLVPPPDRHIPLMLGAKGDRMFAIGLPHADWCNSSFSEYGNTAEGYVQLHAHISAAAERAGRDPGEVARSVGVRVVLDPATSPRKEDIRPQTLAELPGHLRALAEAGAAEAVIVLPTTNEESVRAFGPMLADLSRRPDRNVNEEAGNDLRTPHVHRPSRQDDAAAGTVPGSGL